MDWKATIPDYAKAVERESFLRTAAFVIDRERIDCFEVESMTFRHWLILRMVKSPVAFGGVITPEALENFLWLVTPKPADRATFAKCCRFFHAPPEPILHMPWLMKRWERRLAMANEAFKRVFKAAREYCEDNILDLPGGNESGRDEKSYYSEGCGVCALFAKEYHFPPEVTLNLRMRQLLQFYNELTERRNASLPAMSRRPLVNPSDRILQQWQDEQNK